MLILHSTLQHILALSVVVGGSRFNHIWLDSVSACTLSFLTVSIHYGWYHVFATLLTDDWYKCLYNGEELMSLKAKSISQHFSSFLNHIELISSRNVPSYEEEMSLIGASPHDTTSEKDKDGEIICHHRLVDGFNKKTSTRQKNSLCDC